MENADNFGREFLLEGRSPVEKQGRKNCGKNLLTNSLRNLPAIFLKIAGPRQKDSPRIRSAEPPDQKLPSARKQIKIWSFFFVAVAFVIINFTQICVAFAFVMIMLDSRKPLQQAIFRKMTNSQRFSSSSPGILIFSLVVVFVRMAL